ncbi:MAG: EAL domain-containing protein [Solirubrobacterales bacterium]
MAREREARREAEEISERAIREAFERERGLKLLAEVATAANKATDPEDALLAAITGVCEHTGWPVGHVYLRKADEPGSFRPTDIWHLDEPRGDFESFVEVTMATPMTAGVGLPGRVGQSKAPVWIADVTADPNFPRAHSAVEIGVRAAFAFPALVGGEVEAVAEFFTPEQLEPDQAMLDLMAQVGVQVGLVLERIEAARSLERVSRQNELLLAAAGDGICGLDSEGRTTFVNPAAAEMLGAPASALIGVHAHELFHNAGPAANGHSVEDCPLTSALRDGISVSVEEESFFRSDGLSFPVSFTVTPIHDRGDQRGAVLTFRDVSERRRFERQLRHFADRDPLTDLFNRRRFEEELTRQAAQAVRRGGAGAVVQLGLDNFKYVNDTFGHHAGDEVIRRVAGLLRERLREADVLARLGGDVFALLLTDASEGEAKAVAEELIALVRAQSWSFDSREARITASAGMNLLGGAETTTEELMVRADLAMYRAKDDGRDRVSAYTVEAAAETRSRIGLTWVERIRRALEEDGFDLFGQPIVDLRAGNVSQLEILLRMPGDDGEWIPPSAFLPTAERFGLINQVDSWVVRQAIDVLRLRQERGARQIPFEVNLSGITMGDPELPKLIESELERTGVDPSSLVFEITETAASSSMDAARSFAESLTRLGCRFALDDFGAGFGSFFYLKYLPLDYLKIDGEFIQNLPRSPVDQRMVRAMIDIAHGLGLRTIAEFVENERTLSLLQEYGNDFIQGYHVGRPRPLSELLG